MTALTQVNPWVVFAVASVAVFLVSVDATIAVAAFPSLRGSFADTSPATLSSVLKRVAGVQVQDFQVERIVIR